MKSPKNCQLICNISKLYTLKGALEKHGRNIKEADLTEIKNAAMVISEKGQIIWSGKEADTPTKYLKSKKINAKGKIVIPGFVDSHTHLVFAGDRSQEFEMKLAGKSYNEIAQAGGGILSTVNATREISEKKLLKISLQRANCFLAQGVTTFEIKSGYGLSFESEKKILKVIQDLKKKTKATIKSTFLAAHAIPTEFKNKQSEYVDTLANQWLPKLKTMIDFVDIFQDEGYFNSNDTDVLMNSADKLNIPLKIHADELKLSGGVASAVKHKALSADHLLKISDDEIKMLADSEVTATLLPTTAFFLNVDFAPARKLLQAGARVALATDFNPGTSPSLDISLTALLAALKMKMTTYEIIAALTLNGAYALGLQKRKGALLPGYDADFLIIDSNSPAQIFYEFGQRPLNVEVFVKGQPLKKS